MQVISTITPRKASDLRKEAVERRRRGDPVEDFVALWGALESAVKAECGSLRGPERMNHELTSSGAQSAYAALYRAVHEDGTTFAWEQSSEQPGTNRQTGRQVKLPQKKRNPLLSTATA